MITYSLGGGCVAVTAVTVNAVPAAIAAMVVTVLGLSAVTTSDALAQVLEGRSTLMYWLQTGAIAGYAAVLAMLY